MANVVQIRNLQNLGAYLPDGVWQVMEGLLRPAPPALKAGDNLNLYSATALHTIVEISNTAGSYPLVVVARSNGTACTVKLYEEDSADVTVGTTEAVLSVGVSAPSGGGAR